MRGRQDSIDQIRSKVQIDTSSDITDYQYNHNGMQLAVSDADGFIYIFHRKGEIFNQIAQFKADQSAIWKISWADPTYGEILGIGSFKGKVAVFQNKKNNWTEVAYHEIHKGSVNHVEWASSAFGLKLYSAGNQGSVAILELKKKQWIYFNFRAHECSINSLSLRPVPLNDQQIQNNNAYPMIATVAKDNAVKIWKHISEFTKNDLLAESKYYQQLISFKPHKQAVRTLLWKKRWFEANPIQYELLTCSEDGTVKLSSFINNKLGQIIIICQHDYPISKLSQSFTGNMLSVSVANQQYKTHLYSEQDGWDTWVEIQELS